MAPSSPRRKEPTTTGHPAALPANSPVAPPRKKKKRKAPSPPTPPPTPPSPPPEPFQRTWPPADEVCILKALATHRRANGGHLPTAVVLFKALDGRLEKKGVGAREVSEKQRRLKRRYDRDAKKVAPPTDEHKRRLYLLSSKVWAEDSPPEPLVAQAKIPSPLEPPTAKATQVKTASETTSKGALVPEPRTLAQMRELYPYLVEEAMALVHPPVVRNLLPSIEDREAKALNKKIKRARKRLTDVVTELARKKNMETPIVFLCPSAKLQQEKSRVEEIGGMDISDKEQLAKLTCEVAELKQIIMAYQNQGIRFGYEESRPQSVVAENQISCNIVQKKVQVPNDLPHGKNEVVTSKYKYDGVLPSNVPCDNLGGKEVILLSLERPHRPVGKAILQPSSQFTIVGGKKLGPECRKVLLREVYKRDAQLFHEHGKMKMMSDALKCSIAWPSYLILYNAISKAPAH